MSRRLCVPVLLVAFLLGVAARAPAEKVDFDDLTLPLNAFWNGPDPNGVDLPGRFGATERVGEFASRGVAFSNAYNLTFSGSWRGFAYSNLDLGAATGGDAQFIAATGDGSGPGADNYGVAFGYHDLIDGVDERGAFDPNNPAHRNALPTLTLPEGQNALSVQVTNTARVLDSIDNGDPFAKEFGGESGQDPDWFKITAYGSDASGALLPASVDFYLADFRASDPEDDFAVRDWTTWDLRPLAGAAQIHFNLSSSDVGQFGMNTPAYFALDDLLLSPTANGDLNGDGLATAADFAVWRDTGGHPAVYELWRENFTTLTPPASASAAQAVPEPAAWWLAAAVLAALPAAGRRRSR